MTTALQDHQKASLMLDLLGDTPDEIAGTLGWLGCRGDIGKAETCPIAWYFMRHGFDDPTVSDEYVHLPYSAAEVELSLAATDFVVDFDGGLFPDLIGR